MLSGTGDFIADFIIALEASDVLVMLGIILIYLVLGMFLEPIGAMLLTLPVLLPIIESTSFSLIWFGVVLTKLLEIGMITPPVGMNVFVVKSVVGDLVTTSQVFKGILWFLVIDLAIVGVFLLFPEILLYLPELLSN